MKLCPDVAYVTLKADTALACACEVCVLPNLGPPHRIMNESRRACGVKLSTRGARQYFGWFLLPIY